MASSDRPARPTKAQLIARRLAEDIASGSFAAGTTLDEASIATRYGVSRTPIREAIRQLSASGIVECRPHRGASVPALSEQQLDDIFVVMADLEALCARAAASAMTAVEHDRLRQFIRVAWTCVEVSDRAGYATLNDQFHALIHAGSRNSFLARLTDETRAKVAPHRRVQVAVSGRLALSLAEHEQIAEAIGRGDPCRAYEAMHRHVVRTRESWEPQAGIRPPALA